MHKKLFYTFFVLSVIFSCTSIDIECPDILDENAIELCETVYFHASSGFYLKQQNDPFALDNMQAAYDKVTSTKGETVFFKEGRKLSPTHLALKIYPRTLKEWSSIDQMEDIGISYYPFDYVPVPEKTVSAPNQNTSFEKTKYTETYIYTPTDSYVEVEETVSLPILYVVWPASKELPREYDFLIDYEVFIPASSISTKSGSEMTLSERRTLEKEAISLALGEDLVDRTPTKNRFAPDDSSNFKVLTGSISCFDNSYNGLLPLPKLGMRFQLGAFIFDTFSNDLGTYNITIDTEYHPYLYFSFSFRSQNFEVRLADHPSYYQYGLGTVENVFGSGIYGHQDFDLSTLPTQVTHAHRAATYYYRGSHEVTKYSSDGTRVVIKALSTTHPDNPNIRGSFGFTSGIPTIIIYNNGSSYSSHYIGTTLHELGHYLHFGLVGHDAFYSTELLLTESFSSFVGWSLGHQYYQQYNYSLISGLYDETGQGRQEWTGPNSPYSPLFIDLQDSFNQRSYGGSYVIDYVSGVPYSVIQSIITNCSTWASVRQTLASLIGTYFTQNNFNAFIYLYDD